MKICEKVLAIFARQQYTIYIRRRSGKYPEEADMEKQVKIDEITYDAKLMYRVWYEDKGLQTALFDTKAGAERFCEVVKGIISTWRWSTMIEE